MPLTASDIIAAFDALSAELAVHHTRAEIIVAGGAALVLLYGARPSTKDVDAYFLGPDAAILRAAAQRVAQKLDLPDDWLNDGVKGYFLGITKGEVLFESQSLTARAASTAQLLAMKLAAWRDAIDRGDAMLLLSHMRGSQAEVWSEVLPLVPVAQRNKASYAFEDLWEAIHGAQ